MDAETHYIRRKHIILLQKNFATFQHLYKILTPHQLLELRDGPEGWTPLQILCHVRDFDIIFMERAQAVCEQEMPSFIVYDVDQLARDRQYEREALDDVLSQFQTSRDRLIAFWSDIKDEEWSRSGIHPAAGPMTLLQILVQASHHDADHLEQMTRVVFG